MSVLDIKTGGHEEPHYKLQVAAYLEMQHRGTDEGLEFDEEKHLFTVKGEVIPSVTQILRQEGFCPSLDWIDPWYLQRGTYVHRATELYDKGTLDEESLSPEIIPYLESYKRARAEIGFTITAIELKLWHPVYRYAGIIDRVIEGRKSYILYLTPGVNNGYKRETVENSRQNLNTFLSARNCRAWKELNLKEM
jgi:hypothetical protein